MAADGATRGQSSQNREANDNITRSVTVLGRILNSECDPTTPPVGLDKALADIRDKGGQDIAKALLQTGFPCWYSYYVACQRGIPHGLDQLSLTELESVGTQVTAAHQHASVAQLLSSLFQGPRGEKRSKYIDTIVPSLI
jgi:hypothetical protein